MLTYHYSLSRRALAQPQPRARAALAAGRRVVDAHERPRVAREQAVDRHRRLAELRRDLVDPIFSASRVKGAGLLAAAVRVRARASCVLEVGSFGRTVGRHAPPRRRIVGARLTIAFHEIVVARVGRISERRRSVDVVPGQPAHIDTVLHIRSVDALRGRPAIRAHARRAGNAANVGVALRRAALEVDVAVRLFGSALFQFCPDRHCRQGRGQRKHRVLQEPPGFRS